MRRMMKWAFWAIGVCCLLPCPALPQEAGKSTNVQLEEIVVKDTKGRSLAEIDAKAPTTQDTIPKSGIDVLLNEAQVGSYKALEMLPSVNTQSGDAYGLALGKTLRLRGSYQGDEFLRNIEGLPVSSHGGGGDFIDFENVEAVQVYRGAEPAARSFGVRNLTGLADLSLLWPQDKFGGTIKQSFGTSSFMRTYARVDSGLLPTGTKFFASSSTTSADKWRGEGGQPKGRENFEMAVSQKLGDKVRFDIFGVYQELKQHDFRSLTYDQAKHLSQYNDFDYNKSLTGIPSQDTNYYDFTRQYYKDTMFLGNLEITPTAKTRITLKPYYWEDNGYRFMGGSGNGYRFLTTRPKQYGAVGQYDFTLSPVDFSVGYWYHVGEESLPPPLEQKSFTLMTVRGSETTTFGGWSSLQKASNRTFNVPYAIAKTTLGKTTLVGSLKYVYQRDPTMTFYRTAGLPDVNYDDVFAYNPSVDSQIKSRTWKDWEPSFSVIQALRDDLNLYFAYGRGYQYSGWSGQRSAYTNNTAAFQAAGITLNQLYDSLEPERLDNFDLGLRFRKGIVTVAPTVYYTIDKHKSVTVYDPAVNAAYMRSDANATAYGAELEVTVQPPMPAGRLNLYVSGSYNSNTFDDDIRNASNNVVRTKGQQLPDTPEYMAKLGATYSIGRFSATPLLRYMSARYGDVENKQKIDSNFLTDLYLSYDTGRVSIAENCRFTLTVLNLFDKKYIGIINTSDTTQASGTSYYPGAPLTVMGGVQLKF